MEGFLVKNNLLHLSAVFEEQKITDTELLKLLTEEEIGLLVTNIGDKIRLKRGIRNLELNEAFHSYSLDQLSNPFQYNIHYTGDGKSVVPTM